MRRAEDPPELRDRAASPPLLERSSLTFSILIWKKFSSFQNQIETPAPLITCPTLVRVEGELKGPNENMIQRSTLQQNNGLLQTAKTPEECYTFVSVDWSHQTGGTRKWLPSNCPHPDRQDLQSRTTKFIQIHIRTRPKTKQSQWIIILAVPLSCGGTVLNDSFACYLIKICKYLTKYPNSGSMQPMFRMFSCVKKD